MCYYITKLSVNLVVYFVMLLDRLEIFYYFYAYLLVIVIVQYFLARYLLLILVALAVLEAYVCIILYLSNNSPKNYIVK